MARTQGTLVPTFAALALLVGVFAPLADVEIYGSVSLFDVSETQGLLLLLVAVLTLLVVFIRDLPKLTLCAVGAWAALLYPLLERWLTPRDDSPLGQLEEAFSKAASDAFTDIVFDVVTNITQIRWGGAALLGGCVLLSVAAWRRRR